MPAQEAIENHEFQGSVAEFEGRELLFSQPYLTALATTVTLAVLLIGYPNRLLPDDREGATRAFASVASTRDRKFV
jgi:hypothetical protein